MMRWTRIAIAAACLVTAAASAAPVVTVLGQPLGGKLKMPIRVCAPSEGGSDVRSLCWVDQPNNIGGTRMGMLAIPGRDTRPAWAAYATFATSVGRDGTLMQLTARTFDAKQFAAIAASIAGRFGVPTESHAFPSGSSSSWSKPDIHIRLLCSPGHGCSTEFSSAQEYAELQRQLAARKALDAGRPASP